MVNQLVNQMMNQKIISVALISVFLLSCSNSASKKEAEEYRGPGITFDAREDVSKDFDRVCAISIEKDRLMKSASFKKKEKEWNKNIAERIDTDLKTTSVKKIWAALQDTDVKTKTKYWHEAAKQNYYEKFHCPTIGVL